MLLAWTVMYGRRTANGVGWYGGDGIAKSTMLLACTVMHG
jgi:hypothetical protein